MSTYVDPVQEHETNPTTPGVAPPQLGGYGQRPVVAREPIRDRATGAVTGSKEGEARAEYFQTARMANDPEMAKANALPTDLMSQPGAVPQLLEAQKAAREGGKHKEYQAKRAKFEHEVGLLAAEDPKALGTMKAMCEKAKDWIKIMGGGDDAYARLAGDAATGYGGAVGEAFEEKQPDGTVKEDADKKKANAEMAKAIMGGGGNVREMAMALQNFQTMMAKDLMDPKVGPDGLTKRQRFEAEMAKRKAAEEAAKAAQGGAPEVAEKSGEQVAADAEKKGASLTGDDMEAMLKRFDETGAGKAKKAGDAAKAMFSPTKAEKEEGGRHEQFGEAKKEEHDTKMPPMPTEAADVARKQQAAQVSIDLATTKITALTGQKAAAQAAATAAEQQAAQAEARAGSAPPEQKAAASQQAASARATAAAKKAEVTRLEAEIGRAKAELDAARAQLAQAKTEVAKPATGGKTEAGEKNPLAWSTEKVEEKKEKQADGTEKTVFVSESGLKLSEREAAAMKRAHNPNAEGGATNVVPMIVGQQANIIESDAPFISEANAADMPLKSGISGTTFRFMELADLMGQPPENARLAMIGHLTPIGAHSIHEINTAASGFGEKDADKDGKKDAAGAGAPPESTVAYDAKNPNTAGGPYTAEKMKPLTTEQLTACAMKAGFASLEEANTPPPDTDLAAKPAAA